MTKRKVAKMEVPTVFVLKDGSTIHGTLSTTLSLDLGRDGIQSLTVDSSFKSPDLPATTIKVRNSVTFP